jgi:hypothetical protein
MRLPLCHSLELPRLALLARHVELEVISDTGYEAVGDGLSSAVVQFTLNGHEFRHLAGLQHPAVRVPSTLGCPRLPGGEVDAEWNACLISHNEFDGDTVINLHNLRASHALLQLAGKITLRDFFLALHMIGTPQRDLSAEVAEDVFD